MGEQGKGAIGGAGKGGVGAFIQRHQKQLDHVVGDRLDKVPGVGGQLKAAGKAVSQDLMAKAEAKFGAKHEGEAHGAEHSDKAHWTHDQQDQWQGVCQNGRHQSPAPLRTTEELVLNPDSKLDFSAYKPAAATVVNNGHTIQMTFKDGPTLKLGAEPYQLKQIHFHTPSEHQIDGKPARIEAHLVHSNAAGDLAVVGVMLNEKVHGGKTPASETLKTMMQNLAPEKNQEWAIPGTVDPSAFLPKERSAFRYDGSLTTPPCSEGVRWTVMEQPVDISAAQGLKLEWKLSESGPNAREQQDAQPVTKSE